MCPIRGLIGRWGFRRGLGAARLGGNAAIAARQDGAAVPPIATEVAVTTEPDRAPHRRRAGRHRLVECARRGPAEVLDAPSRQHRPRGRCLGGLQARRGSDSGRRRVALVAPPLQVTSALRCKSAWGPDADRRGKCLTLRDTEGSRPGAYSHSAAIRCFSSTLQRRRRPVSTISRRRNGQLSVRISVTTVSYDTDLPHKAAPGGGLRRGRCWDSNYRRIRWAGLPLAKAGGCRPAPLSGVSCLR